MNIKLLKTTGINPKVCYQMPKSD